MNKKIKFNFLLLITVAAFLFSACTAPDQSSDLRAGGFINLNSSAGSADLSTLTSDFTVESSVQNNYRTYINHELVNECDFADDLIAAAKNNENSSFRTVFFDENKNLSSYYDIISDKDGYHFVSYEKDKDKFIQSKQSFSCLKVFNVYGTPPDELKELGERNWYLNVVVLAKDRGATYEDVADVMLSFGAVNALNLDGGSSSTMLYQGEFQNISSSLIGQRGLPTGIIVLSEEDVK